jgi:hypothetical protein
VLLGCNFASSFESRFSFQKARVVEDVRPILYLYYKREGCPDFEGSKDPLAGLGFGWEGNHRKAGNVQGGTQPSKFQKRGSKYLENAKA